MKRMLAIFLVTCCLMVAFASIAYASTHTFYIQNLTGYTIYAVYVKASGSSNWGSDLLSSNVLYNGEYFYVTLYGYSSAWDIAVKDRYGTWHYWWGQPLYNYSGITLR